MRRSRRSTDTRLSAAGRRWADERGSASLEFITVGLLLLLPVVYLVLTLAALQGASLAVEGATRQAARVFVQSGSLADAQAAAQTAIEVTLADYGLDADAAEVQISCRPSPADCLRRQGFVTVTVSTTVPLPLVPPVLQLDLPSGIPVSAVSTEQVSRFAGAG